MEERIAAAIRLQATPQIAPALNLMNGFVLNETLEDDGRRLPVDALEGQKATIEPRLEQVRQVGVDFSATWMVGQRGQQPPTHIDEDRRSARRHVAPPEQLLPRRFNRLLQRQQVGRRLVESIRIGRLANVFGIDGERLGESIEEALDLVVVKALICAEHVGGNSRARDLTTLREERAAQINRVLDVAGFREIGAGTFQRAKNAREI